jgi:ABC-type transport system substrate-binding protein
LDEILVGTGPWKMKSHSPRREIRYERNGRWWGKAQYFDQVIMKFVDDDTARMNAGLAGQYDYVSGVLKTYIDQFRTTTGMHVEDIGEGFGYYYFEIYCGPRDYDGNMIVAGDPQHQRNNATFRRALSYAMNYTYIIEEIQQGKAFYGVPAVPRAFPGHNSSVWFGYNESSYTVQIEKARALIKICYPSVALPVTMDGGSNDAAWKALSLIDLEMNEHSGGGLSTDLSLIAEASFDLIGVDVTVTVREWGEYLDVGELTPWEMDCGFVGWGPDYLNPYNMIDPLYNLASGSCFSRINDTSSGGLTEQLQAAVEETDYATQLTLWENLQSYLYDVRFEHPGSCCHIPAYVYFVQQVHKDTLMGVQYNLLGDFNWANWYEEE